MRSRALPIALGMLAACSNAPMAASLSAASPAPAPDVLQCARGQLKAVGFDQTSLDLADYRVNARRFDETVRRPDVTFRRMVDRLEIEVAPSTGASMSTLEVVAKTFAESVTQRGPTETQEATSTTARAAAETILKKCGGNSITTPDSAAATVPTVPQS